MDLILIMGLAAGIITSISFIPQLIKGYQTKKLDDVSYGMYFVLTAGMSLWFAYGVLLEELPIIAANGFGVGCCIYVIIMKMIYARRTHNL